MEKFVYTTNMWTLEYFEVDINSVDLLKKHYYIEFYLFIYLLLELFWVKKKLQKYYRAIYKDSKAKIEFSEMKYT